MTPEQKTLVRDSFAKVAPIADAAATLFYDRLFAIAPEVKPLFHGDMAEQRRKLMAMLGTAVANLDRLETVVPGLRAMGARHAGYGVQEAHYAPVGEALLWTLQQGLGDGFTPDVREAWVACYGVIAEQMQDAARQAARA